MDGVVMLVNEYPPLPVGGSERQAERLATYLAAQGRPVWVITKYAPGLKREEVRANVTILRPYTYGPGKIKTITFVLGTILKLWQLRRQYSLLHAHMLFGPAFAGAWIRRVLNKRLLVKLGSSGETGEIRTSQKTLRGRWRLATLRRWADAMIVLDDGMREEAISAGFSAARIHNIPNGIDAQSFCQLSASSKYDAKKKLGLADRVVILFVGRLVKEKSLPTLLSAFAAAARDCPALWLEIVGEGYERDRLEAQALQLKITKSMRFSGRQTDVRPYLQAADIFALPSITEGISNALLEAMSANLACLATPVGGNAEALDHGRCGILLPPRDVVAWEQALAQVGRDAALRRELGQAARQRILERYDFSIIGSRYQTLYANLRDGGR